MTQAWYPACFMGKETQALALPSPAARSGPGLGLPGPAQKPQAATTCWPRHHQVPGPGAQSLGKGQGAGVPPRAVTRGGSRGWGPRLGPGILSCPRGGPTLTEPRVTTCPLPQSSRDLPSLVSKVGRTARASPHTSQDGCAAHSRVPQEHHGPHRTAPGLGHFHFCAGNGLLQIQLYLSPVNLSAYDTRYAKP